MTQTAQNTQITLESDVWTLISEVNCTFVSVDGSIEVLGMDGSAPSLSDKGIPYASGQGEAAATDTLSRFVGAGTADRIYAISRGRKTNVFVSREAVA